MRHRSSSSGPRRGITVLGLLLLIIALVVAGIFLVRYLRNRPVASTTSAHQPLDQLNLTGVIQVVRGDAMDLLRIGPRSLG